MVSQTLEILQLSATASKDPYFTYALNLANDLRKYDAHTLSYVKRAIANILFEADVGRLPSYPAASCGSDLHPQPVYSPSSDTSSHFGQDLKTKLEPTSPVQPDPLT